VRRTGIRTLLIAVSALGLGLAASGCGDSVDKKASPPTTTATTEKKQPVPRSLGQAESGAEDTIDFAQSGNRSRVVATARKLRRVAEGPAARDLRRAHVPEGPIAELRDRARLVQALAAGAALLRVSLAANQVSALMPQFYAHYADPVPPDVLKLDYLDREAELRSKARDRSTVGAAVDELSSTWAKLQPEVRSAGGDKVAAAFTRHVAAMRRLAKGADWRALQNEARTGLELVDRLEGVFRRK
jgi:hypothetical protein